MTKIIAANVLISGIAVAVLGLAAPAQTAPAANVLPVSASEFKAGVDHLQWLDDIRPKVKVPRVDPSAS